MAASPRRYRATLPTQPAWPARENAPGRLPKRALQRKAAVRRRWFAMLVVVPVLLMLGSVYLHTVAAGLDTKAAELGVTLDRAIDKGERLKVRVTELSGSARIQERAEKLGMSEPGSEALRVYGDSAKTKAEDGINDGTQQERGD